MRLGSLAKLPSDERTHQPGVSPPVNLLVPARFVASRKGSGRRDEREGSDKPSVARPLQNRFKAVLVRATVHTARTSISLLGIEVTQSILPGWVGFRKARFEGGNLGVGRTDPNFTPVRGNGWAGHLRWISDRHARWQFERGADGSKRNGRVGRKKWAENYLSLA